MYKLHLNLPSLLVVLEFDLSGKLIMLLLHELLEGFRKQDLRVNTKHLANVLELLRDTGEVVLIELDTRG